MFGFRAAWATATPTLVPTLPEGEAQSSKFKVQEKFHTARSIPRPNVANLLVQIEACPLELILSFEL
jgi:hypothetical protein